MLASATGLITDIHLLYLDRFLLGMVESAVLPAMLILQARWYTSAERARANAFLVLGNPVTMLWMSLLSGYLAARLGWRMMFVHGRRAADPVGADLVVAGGRPSA